MILCIQFLSALKIAVQEQLTISQLCHLLMFPSNDTNICSAEKQRLRRCLVLYSTCKCNECVAISGDAMSCDAGLVLVADIYRLHPHVARLLLVKLKDKKCKTQGLYLTLSNMLLMVVIAICCHTVSLRETMHDDC